MSFGSTSRIPQPEPKLLGQDASSLPTNEQARPLPWFCGTRRMSLTFISNAFNQLAVPVYEETKKDDVLTGWNYFASFAALVCHGPVHWLGRIYIDDEAVWSGNLQAEGDYAEVMIEGRGLMRIYWGTETQGIDAHLEGAGENHSAMRGQCYVVFEQFFFGYQKTTAPKVELVIGRWPGMNWMSGAVYMGTGDCNPVYALAELLQHPRCGCGFATSRLDTASWNAAAGVVAGEGLGISPILNRQMDFRQAVTMFCEYVDGFPYATADGKVGFKLIRPLNDDVPVLYPDDLIELPKIKTGSWDTTINDLKVKFINSENHFKEDVVTWVNRAHRAIVGEPKTRTADRLWISSPTTANKLAAATGKIESTPRSTGTLVVKESAAASLRAGSLVFLCYPRLRLNQLFRVQSKTIQSPGRGRAELEVIADYSHFADEHFVAQPEPPAPTPPANHTEPIEFQRAIELPYGLKADTYITGATFLAARPNGVTTQFKAHRQKPSGSFEPVLTAASFALYGVLQERYPVTGTFDETVGMSIRLEGTDRTLPATFPIDDAFLNDWLLFVDDEIISIFGARLIGSGQYRVFGIRGRYDTVPRQHLAESPVFILKRSTVPVHQIIGSEIQQVFKLQPFVFGSGLDLADATEITLDVNSRGLRPWQPRNLRAFDALDPVYTTGQDIPISWSNTVLDPAGLDLPETILEFWSGGGLRTTMTFEPGVSEFIWLNDDLQSALGGQVTFTIRAFHRRGEWRSTYYQELTVQRV